MKKKIQEKRNVSVRKKKEKKKKQNKIKEERKRTRKKNQKQKKKKKKKKNFSAILFRIVGFVPKDGRGLHVFDFDIVDKLGNSG